MKRLFLVLFLICSASCLHAQGTLSGDLMANVNFFQRDSLINASNNPLYDNRLSGGESWLSLRYNYKGFTAFLRVDVFNNSNLYTPTQPRTNYGIGAYSLSKEVKGLTITGGYIYDQIGSGILFRSYEDRGLLIDNALVGLQLKYKVGENIYLKAFTGQQKFLFDRYDPVIKGFNAEADYSIGDNIHITPGIGVLNRTLDQQTIDNVVSNIDNYEISKRFVPRYNMYAFTGYNNLIAGDFSWYVEGAYKTHEAIKSSLTSDSLTDDPGNVIYSTFGYARKGIAINLTGKRTDNFVMRTVPNEILFRGLLNWQPIVARLRPQRLMARYTPASLNVSELALGSDVLIAPNDDVSITLNYTYINTLANVELYREAYGEVEYRGLNNTIIDLGVQVLHYNQEVYQLRPGVPIVKAVTPFAEVIYRITNKVSIRGDHQFMFTKQDFGSWFYSLLELSVAPTLSFAVSDMYPVDLNPKNPSGLKTAQHYYQFFTAYTTGPHRFTAAYVKQVDGINCTGGVCRYEPAFSGVKLTITSTF